MNILKVLVFLVFFFAYFFPFYTSDVGRKGIVTIDDVNPTTINKKTLETFLSEHQNATLLVVFVTPHLGGSKLNRTWCRQILELKRKYQFEIGLHGYEHRGPIEGVCGEFLLPHPEKIKKAREEFYSCFGFYPKYFRAPCFQLNLVDYLYVRHLGMKNLGYFRHGKTYHPYPNTSVDWDTLHPSWINKLLNR